MPTLIVMSLFSNMGFIYPVYTMFLLSRGMNMTNILTLESILALGILLWEVPSSLLADRWGRKRMIVLARLLELVVAVPMLWAHGFLAFAMIYFISGLGIACQSGALEAYIYETLGERKDMTRRLGYIHAAQSAGVLRGSLIGGTIMAIYPAQGYVVCLSLAIWAAVPALITAMRLPADVPRAAQTHISLRTILRAGLRAFIRSGQVLVLFLLMFNLPGSVETHYLWQPYLTGFGVPIAWFGLIAIGINLTGILGSLLASWLSQLQQHTVAPTTRQVVLAGGSLSLVFLGLVIFAQQAGWGILALLGLFWLNAVLDPILITQLNQLFPDEARATALSGVSWLGSTARMIIRPGIGYLADLNITYPFRWDLVAMGTSLLVVLAYRGVMSEKKE